MKATTIAAIATTVAAQDWATPAEWGGFVGTSTWGTDAAIIGNGQGTGAVVVEEDIFFPGGLVQDTWAVTNQGATLVGESVSLNGFGTGLYGGSLVGGTTLGLGGLYGGAVLGGSTLGLGGVGLYGGTTLGLGGVGVYGGGFGMPVYGGGFGVPYGGGYGGYPGSQMGIGNPRFDIVFAYGGHNHNQWGPAGYGPQVGPNGSVNQWPTPAAPRGTNCGYSGYQGRGCSEPGRYPAPGQPNNWFMNQPPADYPFAPWDFQPISYNTPNYHAGGYPVNTMGQWW